MVVSSQLSLGMYILVGGIVYRVDDINKIKMPNGQSLSQIRLTDIGTNEVVERNFKPSQTIEEVHLKECQLEYLYPEEDKHVFLDTDSLEQVHIFDSVIGVKVNYLKDGISVSGKSFEKRVFSVDLPQFLELMVESDLHATKHGGDELSTPTKEVLLETGATVVVPNFIEQGDVIKVDTSTNEYIQRV
ncbi:elongation factor P [Chlamydiia bacterium]|nr:elongation factor P [Chlamydiia bacterium]